MAQWEPAKRKLGFYIIMNVANCLKKPLTVEEQIKRLKTHNMVIQDETMAAENPWASQLLSLYRLCTAIQSFREQQRLCTKNHV